MKTAARWSFTLLPLLGTAANACPLCKDAAPVAGDGSVAPGGFNASIFLIFGALAVAIAVVTRALATAARSAVTQAARDANESASSLERPLLAARLADR